MKVLLISSNQLKPSADIPWVPVEPLGLAYVAAGARAAGHEVEFLDLCFEPSIEDAVARAIRAGSPEVIGISFRNIELMTYFRHVSFVEDLKRTVGACRRESAAEIVLGGSGFSLLPERILAATGCRLGIVGEAEDSFPALLERLASGGDPAGVPGVVILENGRLRLKEPSRPDDLSCLRPARELIRHEAYAAAGGGLNVQTKRGCPFRCIYCPYPLIEGRKVRCREPAEVAGDFAEAARLAPGAELYVVDSQFNHPLSHALEVGKELLSIPTGSRPPWSCMLNPAAVTDDLVFLMRMARCRMVDLTVDAACDRMLRNLGKNFTAEDIDRSVGLLLKYRLPFSVWVLFGGPGENRASVRETLERLERIGAPNVLIGVGLRVCPGTRLDRIARAEGIAAEGQDYLEPIYYLAMDAQEILDAGAPFLARHEGWRVAARQAPGDA